MCAKSHILPIPSPKTQPPNVITYMKTHTAIGWSQLLLQCQKWLQPAETRMAHKHSPALWSHICTNVCFPKWPFALSLVSLAIRRYVVINWHISHTEHLPAHPGAVWEQQKAEKVRGEWGAPTRRANGSSPSTTEGLKRNTMFPLGRPGSSSAIVGSSHNINHYYSSETCFSFRPAT